jgi:hypothetical protein
MGGKGKREIYPSPCCEGIQGSRDRDVFLTLALRVDGGDQSTSHPRHFTFGKDIKFSLKRLS